MASIKKKVIGKQTYYYLEHTIRKQGTAKTEELYLGKKIPKNIEDIKKQFLSKIYQEKWHPTLDKIKKGFEQESRKIPPSAEKKETETFAIKFTYNTQRIEGSKLTLRETANLLEKGTSPKNKPIRDVKEAEQHNKVFYEILAYKKDINLQFILYMHKTLFELTNPDIAGKIREHQVGISGCKFVPPLAVEVYPLLQDFFSWYEKNKAETHPVELAALVHLKFVTIHPFSDGNGRTSRLLMNFVLHKNGYPMLDIPYENRSSYYTALERSQVKGIESIFIQWFVKKYIKENKKYLK